MGPLAWLNLGELVDGHKKQVPHFLWLDAGISRFFTGAQPDPEALEILSMLPARGVVIQPGEVWGFRNNLRDLSHDEVIIGSQYNFFNAGVFGGSAESVRLLCYGMMHVLLHDMIAHGVIDNEQVGLARLYLQHSDWFVPLFGSNLTRKECNYICL